MEKKGNVSLYQQLFPSFTFEKKFSNRRKRLEIYRKLRKYLAIKSKEESKNTNPGQYKAMSIF